MIFLLFGILIFFGMHVYSAVRSRAPVEDMRERLGYGPYMGLYSLVSLIGLALIIYGYGAMRPSTVIWVPPVWTRHLNLLIMIPALIFLVAAYAPTGRIRKTLKHPMLVAVKLWAVGHLLANGELNSILLFGSFLAYAVFDRIMVKRRGDHGPGPGAPASLSGDLMSVVIGLAAWAALAFWLHPILFGVRVIS